MIFVTGNSYALRKIPVRLFDQKLSGLPHVSPYNRCNNGCFTSKRTYSIHRNFYFPKSANITKHLKSRQLLPVKVHSTCKIVCATSVTAVLHHHMSLACCRKSYHTPATLAQARIPYPHSIDLHTVRQHLVIAYILLLLLLSGTLFQMMPRVPHHCHHLCLVRRHTCFAQFTKTEHSL